MKVWWITNERGEFVRFEEDPVLDLAYLQDGQVARVIDIPGDERGPVKFAFGDPSVIDERTWNLVAAITKLWTHHEADALAIFEGDLKNVHGRKLKITYEDRWYLLELTDEQAPPHIEYPERAVAS